MKLIEKYFSKNFKMEPSGPNSGNFNYSLIMSSLCIQFFFKL